MPIDALFLGGTSIDLIQDRQKGRGKTVSVGGSITNSAIIAAKLGLKTGLLSKIGKDSFGNFAIDFLKSCKINISGIIQDSNIRTPLAIAKVDKSGVAKYTFYKNSPKDSVVPIKTTPMYLLNTCKVFHTGSSYSYQKETFEETLKFIKYLKKRGVFISYDPNIRPNSIIDKASVKNRVLKLLKLADLAKLSEIDLEYLTGQKSPLKGLERLKKQVNSELVLTLGSKGSICPAGGRRSPAGWTLIRIPAFKVKIADTIGAGDAFTAGLIYRLIKQGGAKFFANMKSNMTFASAISALICTQKGANLGLKNIKQVNSFLSDKIM
ncbi:MAG: carbohydrate kinase [Candidatus Omnitrophica bacterium]|nr:carbohydrate kinase [Candidatus Omnitrophota bacterium]